MGVARSYNSTSALRPDLAFIRASRFGTWGDAASGWATDQEGSLLFEVKVQGSALGARRPRGGGQSHVSQARW